MQTHISKFLNHQNESSSACYSKFYIVEKKNKDFSTQTEI